MYLSTAKRRTKMEKIILRRTDGIEFSMESVMNYVLFVDLFCALVPPRVKHLAVHAKKPRTRKKNRKRVMKIVRR